MLRGSTGTDRYGTLCIYMCLVFNSISYKHLRLEFLSASTDIRSELPGSSPVLLTIPPWSPQWHLRQACGLLPCWDWNSDLCSLGPPSAGKAPPRPSHPHLLSTLGLPDHSTFTSPSPCSSLHSLITPYLPPF